MAVSETTKVLTGDDWKYAKDIKPGDWVFNRLGKPVKVKLVQAFRAEECYRVSFDDDTSVDGDNNLTLPTEDYQYRKRCHEYRGVKKKESKLAARTAPQMLEAGLFYRGKRSQFSVPTTEPIQLPEQPLDIPPFLFGFWYTASGHKGIHTVPEEFAEETIDKFKSHGYKVEVLTQNVKNRVRFRTTPRIKDQIIGRNITSIPTKYLYASKEQRSELIKGIMASRHWNKTSDRGRFEYICSQKRTLSAVQFLFESLGAKTVVPPYNQNRIVVTRQAPFIGELKKQKPIVHLARRFITEIDQITPRTCVHIETEDEDGSFLVNGGFISCH